MDKGIVELGFEGAVSVAVVDAEVGDAHVILRGLERAGESGENWVCGVVAVERTVFEVELVDDFITVAVLGDDAQLDVGKLGCKGVGNAASGVGVVDPWDEVPKDGERGRMEGGERVCGRM
jgi:hypothetical protein